MLRNTDDVAVEYGADVWDNIHALRIPLDVLSEVIRLMERTRTLAFVLASRTRAKNDWAEINDLHKKVMLEFRGRMVAHFTVNNYNDTYITNIADISALAGAAHDASRKRYRPSTQEFVDEFILAMNTWHGVIRYGGFVFVPQPGTGIPSQPPTSPNVDLTAPPVPEQVPADGVPDEPPLYPEPPSFTEPPLPDDLVPFADGTTQPGSMPREQTAGRKRRGI